MAHASAEVQNICPQGIWAEHKGPGPHTRGPDHGNSSHTPIPLCENLRKESSTLLRMVIF